MPALSKWEGQEFLRVLSNIQDEKVRYFLVMLGQAIGESTAQLRRPVHESDQANTSPAHVAEIARRMNAAP